MFLLLAIFDNASMWMAVFADMGASLLVVFNGLRLPWKATEQVEKMCRKVYSCYTVVHMRKWLAIPFVGVYAATAWLGGCSQLLPTRTGAAAKHFGHHDHQHKTADGKDASSDQSRPSVAIPIAHPVTRDVCRPCLGQ